MKLTVIRLSFSFPF